MQKLSRKQVNEIEDMLYMYNSDMRRIGLLRRDLIEQSSSAIDSVKIKNSAVSNPTQKKALFLVTDKEVKLLEWQTDAIFKAVQACEDRPRTMTVKGKSLYKVIFEQYYGRRLPWQLMVIDYHISQWTLIRYRYRLIYECSKQLHIKPEEVKRVA